MAFKINTTTIFDDSGNIDWSIITDRPQYVSTFVSTTLGDGAAGTTAYSVNVAYSAGTLTIWFNSNCNCNCDCTGGDGGDG